MSAPGDLRSLIGGGKRNQVVRYETKSNRGRRAIGGGPKRLARKLFPVPTRLRNFYGVVPVWFSTNCVAAGYSMVIITIESWTIYLREIGRVGKRS